MTSSVPTWRFRKGDDVPEWLCDCVPITPGSPRPTVRFGGDVVVVETDAGFWVLAAGYPTNDAHINITGNGGGGDIQIEAVGKPLFWSKQFSSWGRDEDDGGYGLGPILPDPLLLQD